MKINFDYDIIPPGIDKFIINIVKEEDKIGNAIPLILDCIFRHSEDIEFPEILYPLLRIDPFIFAKGFTCIKSINRKILEEVQFLGALIVDISLDDLSRKDLVETDLYKFINNFSSRERNRRKEFHSFFLEGMFKHAKEVIRGTNR